MSNDEMGEKVQEILAQNPGGWVIDGNYNSPKLGPIVREAATDIICMAGFAPALVLHD
jgi:hypothetical protein